MLPVVERAGATGRTKGASRATLPAKGNLVIPQRIVLASVVGLASAFVLGACGSSNDMASGTGPSSTAPVDTATSNAAAPASPTGAGTSGSGDLSTATMLVARAANGTGSVVTDDKGMTLYRYDKDQATPSKWTCSGACTKTWLPVIVQDSTHSVQAKGIAKSLIGTVHRNGMKQLTLAGWPLYRYIGDTTAGQTNGQGKGDEWYAVTPSGQKAAATG